VRALKINPLSLVLFVDEDILGLCVARACVRAYRIIVETDPTTIASRVSRPRADTTEIVINEQTILNAYQTVKEKMQQRIGQF
jgi:hypothetical protein